MTEQRKKYLKDQRVKRLIKQKAWFTDYKKHLHCHVCGDNRPEVLDFHHTDPKNKSFMLTKVHSKCYSVSTIMKEISKCTILCSNCHRMLHAQERALQ
jgi:hypothetical protein